MIIQYIYIQKTKKAKKRAGAGLTRPGFTQVSVVVPCPERGFPRPGYFICSPPVAGVEYADKTYHSLS